MVWGCTTMDFAMVKRQGKKLVAASQFIEQFYCTSQFFWPKLQRQSGWLPWTTTCPVLPCQPPHSFHYCNLEKEKLQLVQASKQGCSNSS
jgi:hypothetical protein